MRNIHVYDIPYDRMDFLFNTSKFSAFTSHVGKEMEVEERIWGHHTGKISNIAMEAQVDNPKN